MGLLGGSTTTKNQTILNPQQKALVGLGMPAAKKYAMTNPTISGKTPMVAGFTAPQMQGQNMALAAAKGGQQNLANESADTSKFLLHDVLFPGSNPALAGTIDAATRPIQQNLMEETLPGLRSGAAVGGQYGSSRQGLAEGLASGRASQAIGDTGAKVANANYQAGLDAMTKALGLVPQTQAAQLAPAVTTSGVGEVQQGQKQDTIDANLARQMYNKNAYITKAQNLIGLASGTPGGGTSSSATGKTGLLSGALGGASLGAKLFPGVAGAAGGAGIGALLAALS